MIQNAQQTAAPAAGACSPGPPNTCLASQELRGAPVPGSKEMLPLVKTPEQAAEKTETTVQLFPI